MVSMRVMMYLPITTIEEVLRGEADANKDGVSITSIVLRKGGGIKSYPVK